MKTRAGTRGRMRATANTGDQRIGARADARVTVRAKAGTREE